MNFEEFDPEDKEIIDLQIVDYNTSFGAYIDRELNDYYKVAPTKSRLYKKRNNFSSYMFTQNEDPPKEMTMNIQFVVRVNTCLKLNLEDENGQMIREENSLDKESHYLVFESVTDRYELTYRVLGQLFSKIWSKKLNFEEFVIVDFDNCLNGNKHV